MAEREEVSHNNISMPSRDLTIDSPSTASFVSFLLSTVIFEVDVIVLVHFFGRRLSIYATLHSDKNIARRTSTEIKTTQVFLSDAACSNSCQQSALVLAISCLLLRFSAVLPIVVVNDLRVVSSSITLILSLQSPINLGKRTGLRTLRLENVCEDSATTIGTLDSCRYHRTSYYQRQCGEGKESMRRPEQLRGPLP